MGDVLLFVDDMKSNYAFSCCRICHEEELQSCNSLEAPCACSGTVKVKKKTCSCSCGCVLFLLFNLFYTTKFNFYFALLFSVCTPGLYTEVVQREGQHHLWNLSPGLYLSLSSMFFMFCFFCFENFFFFMCVCVFFFFFFF